MLRTWKPASLFCYFNPSPEVIRTLVLMCIQPPVRCPGQVSGGVRAGIADARHIDR